MDLDTVADELYGLPPRDFTATRDERARVARAAGDRDLAARIRRLRRPTLAAWGANLLVREQPEDARALVRLGEGLRRAHRDLDGEQLRQLSARQRDLLPALVGQARRLAERAGQPLGESALREVEETLRAALADRRSAREWVAGRLTRPLSASADISVLSPSRTPRTAAEGSPGGAAASGRVADLDEARARRARRRARQDERASPGEPGEPEQGEQRDASKARGKREQREQHRQREKREQREQREREQRSARADREARAREAERDDARDEEHRARDWTDRAEQRFAELSRQVKEAGSERRRARAALDDARRHAEEADRVARTARRRARDAER